MRIEARGQQKRFASASAIQRRFLAHGSAAPAASSSAAIEAAMPMQVVETCGFTYSIVS